MKNDKNGGAVKSKLSYKSNLALAILLLVKAVPAKVWSKTKE